MLLLRFFFCLHIHSNNLCLRAGDVWNVPPYKKMEDVPNNEKSTSKNPLQW